jgi:glycopeptide antibiotics resistance protein
VPLRSLAEQIGSLLAGQDVVRNTVYLIGNLVGFVPLGFFLPALFARQRRFPMFLCTVLPAVAVLELVQVLTMRGFCDVDDILLNTAGACIGFRTLRAPVRRLAGLRTDGDGGQKP